MLIVSKKSLKTAIKHSELHFVFYFKNNVLCVYIQYEQRI
jgi:hypothetical protein